MRVKISIILFLVFSLIGGVSAGDLVDGTDSFVQYGQQSDHYYGHQCEGDDCSSTEHTVEVCGDAFYAYPDLDENPNYNYENPNLRAPYDTSFGGSGNEIQCWPGHFPNLDVINEYTFSSDDYLGTAGSLTVSYDAQGENIGFTKCRSLTGLFYCGYNTPGHEIRRLSFGSWGSPGQIRLKEENCAENWNAGCTDFREAQTNVIFSEHSGNGRTNNLNEMIVEKDQYDDPHTASPGRAATLELQDMRDECHGRCPLGHLDGQNDPDYLLRGEVIMGKEFDPEDEWPEGISLETSQKMFHVCETNSVDNMVDTFVWSPGDNFQSDYFRCNSQGQWETLEECDPGYRWDAGLSECEPKDGVINVDFFELDGVPGLDQGYDAGFRIESSEIDVFEDVYGFPATYIGAKCWMGAKDDRPSDDDLIGLTERTSSSSGFYGDVQVIADLPERDIDTFDEIDKYSCIFSIENPDEGVSLGSNDPCTNDCLEPIITVNKRDSHLPMTYGGLRHAGFTSEAFPTEHSYSDTDIDGNLFNHHPNVDYLSRFVY